VDLATHHRVGQGRPVLRNATHITQETRIQGAGRAAAGRAAAGRAAGRAGRRRKAYASLEPIRDLQITVWISIP
jgi:hypothetical protein